MKDAFKKFAVALLLTVSCAAHGQDVVQPPSPAEVRIQREVRHELLMLPYLDVFDNLTYSVNGRSVILSGQVTNPTLRSDAANAVKQIEGVETVDNQIEVLPASIFDDRIRKQLFQAIYGYPTLQRYSLGINKPIRIIIRNGNVQLEGIVDRPLDKVIAGIRARQVSGVFSVENNLKLAK